MFTGFTMDLKTVRDAFDRVVKKQELTTKYHQVMIQRIDDEIKKAITDLQSADDNSSIDHKSVTKHLRDTLDAYSIKEQLKKPRKDLDVELSDYSEILGKFVETDISKAYRNVNFDSHIVNQIILNLLYQEGLFDVGDIFMNEVQEPDIISLRSQFSEMHRILDALKAKNLEPALNWVSVNREKLNETGSNLEFDLRRLQFLDIIKENNSDAVNLAQTYVSSFYPKLKRKFSKFMTCLIWAGKLESSPYSDLLSPEKWAAVMNEFLVQFCGSIGMSFKNPLAVTVTAGAKILPALLEMKNLMSREKWEAMGHVPVPVPVEMGKEFQFHSVFVCPVCWEQSESRDKNNPAIMFDDCGDVLCNNTVMTLITNMGCLKCPICSDGKLVDRSKELYF